MKKKYIVRLTDGERATLERIVRKLKGSSQKVRRRLPAMAWLCQSGAPLDADGWEKLAREAADEAKTLSDKLGA